MSDDSDALMSASESEVASDDEGEMEDGNTPADRAFNSKATEFNQKAVKVDGMYVDMSRSPPELCSEKALTARYKHEVYEWTIKFKKDEKWHIKTCRANFINRWLTKYGHQTVFSGKFVFDPSRPPSFDVASKTLTTGTPDFNLWPGFAAQQINAPDLSDDDVFQEAIYILKAILKHIKEVLTDANAHCFRFVIRWLAQMVQHPEHKGVTLTFISEEGAGKSTFMKLLSRMVGTSIFFSTSSPEQHVWGQFNSMMVQSFLVELSEINQGNMYQMLGRVYQTLTDESLVVTFKGVDSKPLTSCHRFILNTNNKFPCKKGRRFGPVRCSDHMIIPDKCDACIELGIARIDADDGSDAAASDVRCDECSGKKTYHSEMQRIVKEPMAARLLFDFLSSIQDCPVVMTIDEVPETETTQLIKEASQDPLDAYIRKTVVDDLSANQGLRTGTFDILGDDLFQGFKQYVEANESSSKGLSDSKISFSTKLASRKIDGDIKKKRTTTDYKYSFDREKLHKRYDVWAAGAKPGTSEDKGDPDAPRNRPLSRFWQEAFDDTDGFADRWMQERRG